MTSYIVKKTTKPIKTIKRDKSFQGENVLLRASSIAEKSSEDSQSRQLFHTSKPKYRSQSLLTTVNSQPYQKFVKELNIKLPTPKQKFCQFLQIAPFNRIQNNVQLITYFLKKVNFFRIHHASLISSFAKKVTLVTEEQINTKMMLIVLEGQCCYMNNYYSAGSLINRKPLIKEELAINPANCQLISIKIHQYQSYLHSFVLQENSKFAEFINSIQIFKIFTEKTLKKITDSISVHYYLKGETLFMPGQDADALFVVYSGKVARKVTIEIDKINKIPIQKFKKIVRMMSMQYEHHIEFETEDLVGVSQIIENLQFRKEEIKVEADSVIISIERTTIEEDMDQYIKDRFKKYNLKKYPLNYDQLCENYLRQKIEIRKTEERKIAALQCSLQANQSEKRQNKIRSIIKMYEENIKAGDDKNLKKRRLQKPIIINED